MRSVRGVLRQAAERIGDRLRILERDRPDNPIAVYRWLWRALERSSPSPVRLRIRFAMLLVQDALLLLVWGILRPFRSHRSVSLWVTAAALLVAVAWPLSIPDPVEMPEGSAEVAASGRQIGHARMAVLASGLVRFEDELMTASELRHVVRFFVVRSVSVSVDSTTTVGAVAEVADLLREEGIEAVGPAKLSTPARR